MHGNRWSYELHHYNTPNVNVHWIKSYKCNCDFDLKNHICQKGPLFKFYNNFEWKQYCLNPVISDNELVACCQADINCDKIINLINTLI